MPTTTATTRQGTTTAKKPAADAAATTGRTLTIDLSAFDGLDLTERLPGQDATLFEFWRVAAARDAQKLKALVTLTSQLEQAGIPSALYCGMRDSIRAQVKEAHTSCEEFRTHGGSHEATRLLAEINELAVA